MVWVLLVYVVASNGYAAAPSVTSSFHGATFTTRDECSAAARSVAISTSPGTDDVAKSGLILVCAPAQPQPDPAPAAEIIAPAPLQQQLFPPPPPLPAKHPRH